MNKLLLATTCLALSSVGAFAADMTMPMQSKAPMMAAPVFSWTGCYIGAHGGGGALTSGVNNSEGPSTNNSNGSGAVAGGQLGCNYQDGNWVFGLEGEGYWSGIKSVTNEQFFLGSVPNLEGTTVNNRNDFTIAARAGITFDRTLIYGKGGWAWGNYKVSSFETCCGPGATTNTTLQTGTLDGFMVGVGIEHALTRNWTVKMEYDYIAFGAKELGLTQCASNGTCVLSQTSPVSSTKQLFKVGVNYLFDFGAAPVVAKY